MFNSWFLEGVEMALTNIVLLRISNSLGSVLASECLGLNLKDLSSKFIQIELAVERGLVLGFGVGEDTSNAEGALLLGRGVVSAQLGLEASRVDETAAAVGSETSNVQGPVGTDDKGARWCD